MKLLGIFVLFSACTQNISTSLSMIEGEGNKEVTEDIKKTEDEATSSIHAKLGVI